MQEVDCATLRRASKIVVDSREAAMAEAGDLIVAIRRGEIRPSDIYAEIGEVAAALKPGTSGRRRDHILQIGRQRGARRRRRAGDISTGASGRHRSRNRFARLSAVNEAHCAGFHMNDKPQRSPQNTEGFNDFSVFCGDLCGLPSSCV
jgi:hypothetical protein